MNKVAASWRGAGGCLTRPALFLDDPCWKPMNKVAASWRGAGGCLPWPARSGATHDQRIVFWMTLVGSQ